MADFKRQKLVEFTYTDWKRHTDNCNSCKGLRDKPAKPVKPCKVEPKLWKAYQEALRQTGR